MSDDYDDIIDKIKEFFKTNSKMFDIDFFIFPESRLGKKIGLDSEDNEGKGFKVSYHYEPGMDEPEIDVKGDVDEERIKEFLKRAKAQNPRVNPFVRKFVQRKQRRSEPSKKALDASKLSLKPKDKSNEVDFGSAYEEPYAEVNNFNDRVEIVLEVPGVEKEDVDYYFTDENGREYLIVRCDSINRNYRKKIELPYSLLQNACELEVKNGIAILIVKKNN